MAISITLVPNPFSGFAISAALPPSAAIVSAVLARFRTVAGNDSNTLRAALIQPIGLVSWFMAYVVNIDYTSQQISTDQMGSSGICFVAQLRTDASPSRCRAQSVSPRHSRGPDASQERHRQCSRRPAPPTPAPNPAPGVHSARSSPPACDRAAGRSSAAIPREPRP